MSPDIHTGVADLTYLPQLQHGCEIEVLGLHLGQRAYVWDALNTQYHC